VSSVGRELVGEKGERGTQLREKRKEREVGKWKRFNTRQISMKRQGRGGSLVFCRIEGRGNV